MSRKSNTTNLTVDETIQLLKRTSLPTVIVEGCDDMIIYRRFEDDLSHLGVSVLPVGGRLNVLEIFNRINEINNNINIVFIADKDTWINTGVPTAFQHDSLLFTDGYSIENDVYNDAELWKLLQTHELIKFNQDVVNFIEWYALALARHLRDGQSPISLHPNLVLDPVQRPSLLALQTAETYPIALKNALLQDYARLLRGKSLLNLLIKHTNSPSRTARHSHGALFEMVAIRPGARISSLRHRVESTLS
jgi:hypothetical protein